MVKGRKDKFDLGDLTIGSLALVLLENFCAVFFLLYSCVLALPYFCPASGKCIPSSGSAESLD